MPAPHNLFSRRRQRRANIALAIVVGLLVSLLGVVGASAQPVSETQPTPQDIAQRDQLIANQENLLNTYRCLFQTDTELVTGGCADPTTIEPGPAPTQPTPSDLEVRDRLIADQEALLNVYRCQFDIDTQLVPEGCTSQTDQENTNLGPRPINEQALNTYIDIIKTISLECKPTGDWDDARCGRKNYVETIELSRRISEFYSCDSMTQFSCDANINPGEQIWQKRIEFAQFLEDCGYFDGWSFSCKPTYDCEYDNLGLATSCEVAFSEAENNAKATHLGREALQCDYKLTNNWGRPCTRQSWGNPGSSWSSPAVTWLLHQILCGTGWLAETINENTLEIGIKVNYDRSYNATSIQTYPNTNCYHHSHPKVNNILAYLVSHSRLHPDISRDQLPQYNSPRRITYWCQFSADNQIIPSICAGTNMPRGQFTAISAGSLHLCGIKTDKTIICWGSNDYGQLNTPRGQFTAISTVRTTPCGIKTDKTIVCWGYNRAGQADAPRGQFTAISTPCGIKTDKTIVCWGSNNEGQINTPQGQFTAISASGSHSCGIRTDSTAVCWGDNRAGQTDVPQGQFTAISTGTQHSCGIRTDGTAVCWGYNASGQTDAPQDQFITVLADSQNSCGIKTNRAIVCWGSNKWGELNTPQGQFTAISASGGHLCGLKTDKTAVCWGNNDIKGPGFSWFPSLESSNFPNGTRLYAG